MSVLFIIPTDGPIVKFAIVDARTYQTVDVILREEEPS